MILAEWNLMKEWGITKQEFDDTPNDFIETVFEIEQATAEGKERKENQEKAKAILNKRK